MWSQLMLSFGNCDQIEQDIIVTNYVTAGRVLTKQNVFIID
jgi:hypothetical protein